MAYQGRKMYVVFVSKRTFSLNCLLFLLMSLAFCRGSGNTKQQMFHRVRKGGKLETNVISTLIVTQILECSFHCMDTKSCIAFNFRPIKTDASNENCQVSNITIGNGHANNVADDNWILYKKIHTISSNNGRCEKKQCKNGAECIKTNCNGPNCFRCKCTFQFTGKLCDEEKVFNSCKTIFDNYSDAESGVYKIQTITSKFAKVYCAMTSLGECNGGGWTLMMKINGSLSTFNYSSKYWTNKESYNPEGGHTSFDKNETKVELYHSLGFEEICLGMAVTNKTNFVLLSFNNFVSSLYKLMKDENHLSTNLGIDKWKSLIENSSLQTHVCEEGFNLQKTKYCAECSRVRLGITGNEHDKCKTPDSYIGFGGQGTSTCDAPEPKLVSCGNLVRCKKDGAKQIHAFCYIFVR